MNDVNWWLMALAFVLGLLLTLAFMIRRVTREVPIYAALGRGPGADAAGANFKGKSADVDLPDVDAPAKLTGDGPDVEAGEPYGAGSVRLVSARKVGPSGYVVKGNEDSMLYHTTESPSYDQTIAEVWFRDAESAERAGFARWDSNKGSSGNGGGAAKFADIPPGPYGVGSAKSGDAGVGPEGWLVKGNEDSMLYHTVDSPSYRQTIAELWFVDEETATKAGFKRWDVNKNK